jgi:ESS family glutamate:Na+ symporter
MQSPFPFESMLLFGCLAIMLLIGVLLRAKIALFQHFLMPSCLIGGILGLILINVNREFVPVANLDSLAFHTALVGLVYVLTYGW